MYNSGKWTICPPLGLFHSTLSCSSFTGVASAVVLTTSPVGSHLGISFATLHMFSICCVTCRANYRLSMIDLHCIHFKFSGLLSLDVAKYLMFGVSTAHYHSKRFKIIVWKTSITTRMAYVHSIMHCLDNF